jgi:hypothetical protein
VPPTSKTPTVLLRQAEVVQLRDKVKDNPEDRLRRRSEGLVHPAEVVLPSSWREERPPPARISRAR